MNLTPLLETIFLKDCMSMTDHVIQFYVWSTLHTVFYLTEKASKMSPTNEIYNYGDITNSFTHVQFVYDFSSKKMFCSTILNFMRFNAPLVIKYKIRHKIHVISMILLFRFDLQFWMMKWFPAMSYGSWNDI